MPEFNFVQRGDRITIPTMEFRNAVVQMLNRSVNFRRGLVGPSSISVVNPAGDDNKIVIYADDFIDKYHIFTVDEVFGTGTGSFITTGTGTLGDINEDMSFDWRYPRAYSKQIDGTENGPVIIPTKDKSIVSGHTYMMDILGDEEPVLVTYDPDDGVPNVGDALGPKINTYLVTMDASGLVAISGPDTINNRVWVVSIGGGGSTAEYIRYSIVSVDSQAFTALVDIDARPCGVSTVSEEVNGQVTVYDPCQCFLTEPAVDLVGRCGGAKYMKPSIGVCQWEIDYLCCPQC